MWYDDDDDDDDTSHRSKQVFAHYTVMAVMIGLR